MSDRNNEPKNNIPFPKPPRCPHCSADLPGLGLYNWMVSQQAQILGVHCTNEDCLKVLHLQVVQIMVMPDDGDEPKRIQMPS